MHPSNHPAIRIMLDRHSQQLRVGGCMPKVEAMLRNGIERDIHHCGVGRAFITTRRDLPSPRGHATVTIGEGVR